MGKTTVARILARAANCLNPEEHEPDNACTVCEQMLKGASLDLVEIDAASHTGVDDVREIIERISIRPTHSRFRTFIIDEVHMLSRAAFNALLKILEEPPNHILFILATTELHKVPLTVISRTQRFEFRKLEPAQIFGHLKKVVKEQNIKADDDVLASISASVDGSLRDALVLVEKASHLSGKDLDNQTLIRLLGITPVKYRTELLALLRAGDLAEVSKFIKSLAEEGYSVEQFNRDFLDTIQGELVEKPDEFLAKVAESFLLAHAQLRVSPIPELPLMVAAGKVLESAKSPDETSKKKVRIASEQEVLNQNSGDLTVKDVEEQWHQILSRVRNYNQSLLTALKLAKPVGSVNGGITISFPYKFHAETVSAAKNRLVIERVLEEVFGKRLSLKCVMERDANYETRGIKYDASEEVKDNNLLKSALEVLGGEVVE